MAENLDALGHGSKAYLPFFSVDYARSRLYRENWEKVFGAKKKSTKSKSTKSTKSDKNG